MASASPAAAAEEGGASSYYPPSRQLVWHSRRSDPRSRLPALLRGHPFNQQLEIVLPHAPGRALAERLQWTTGFYYEATMPLGRLLTPRFLRDYVHPGRVCMLPKNVAIDAGNTAALLPTGELMLLVDHETYTQLGLVAHGPDYGQDLGRDARPSLRLQKPNQSLGRRHVIRLDLHAPLFANASDTEDPENPVAVRHSRERERIVRCLEERLAPVEMLVAATTERGGAQTLLFDDDADGEVARRRIDLQGTMSHYQDVLLPRLEALYHEADTTAERMDTATLRESLSGVQEWLGVVALGLVDLLRPGSPSVDDYVSSFTGRSDLVPMSNTGEELAVVRWRGLIPAEFIERLVDQVHEAIDDGTVPWAAVTVWGFADAPVSWLQTYALKKKKKKMSSRVARGAATESTNGESLETVASDQETETIAREHGFLVNGHNNYTLVLLPKGEYFSIQELGPHDETK